MKQFLKYLPVLLIGFFLATCLPSTDVKAQKTGVYGFATTVTSSSAVAYLEFYDSTAVWKLPSGAYNPSFKKARQVPKPILFEHDSYHGMVTIRDKNNYNTIYWKGPISYLKVSGQTTGPGALRDSLAVKYLKVHTMNAWPLIPLLFFRIGRRRGRKESHSTTAGRGATG